jgi:hypothetical protein
MSFNKKLNDLVENTIKDFISTVGEKYDLDPNDLYKLWSGEENTPKPTKKLYEVPKATDEIDHKHLLSCKVPELKAMCKQRGLKCSGTKSELIALLLGKKDENTSPSKSPVKKAVIKKCDDTEKPVIKKITSKVSTIPIRRNQFNNHEHPETCLVFCVKSKKVIGKQQDDGSVSQLTVEDIENCHKFKFEYVTPENLESKTKLEDEKVEELEDEEEEDEEIIESEDEIDEEELIEDDDLEEEFEDDDIVYDD